MPKKYSSLAIAGFIFSLLFFIPLFSIIGVTCGIAALIKISKDQKLKGQGLAWAAIIIGALVTILQIFLVILLYNFFIGIFGGIKNLAESPSKGLENCVKQKAGIGKDLCIFLAISTNINQTDNIDKSLCDNHVTYPDMKNLCNALLKKDKSYCYNITDSDSRIKCLGLLEEIKRR